MRGARSAPMLGHRRAPLPHDRCAFVAGREARPARAGGRPMSRPALLLAILLGLGSGLALGIAGETMTAPVTPAARGIDAAADARVRGFYAAVNEVLDTGDAAALDEVVAPDFVDHRDAFEDTAD